jgi:hypothetical protein
MAECDSKIGIALDEMCVSSNKSKRGSKQTVGLIWSVRAYTLVENEFPEGMR